MPCDPQVSAPAGMSPGGGPLQKKPSDWPVVPKGFSYARK